MNAKRINYSGLLFAKEGGKSGIKKLLVSAVSKERNRKGFEPVEIDRICGLGECSPGTKLPTWAQIEKKPESMNGFIFSLVTSLFDLRADRVLKIPARVEHLPKHDYQAIIDEILTNGYGVTAAAAGYDTKLIPAKEQVVPYVVIRIFDELNR
jgi:hypothetical protein